MDDILLGIMRKKAALDRYPALPKGTYKNLQEWFVVELTYTSNAIEGNTLSRQQTALVVEKGITVEGKSIQEHLEAINHAQAYAYIQELAKHKKREELRLQNILDIHKIILQKINDEEAGRIRRTPVRIAGSTTILPNPLKVPDLMGELVTWLREISDNPVKIAIGAHYKLVTIHPFVDGNGRTARLLMNLLLLQAGFPPAIIRKEERNRYITVLEKAQTRQVFDAYYELMYEAVEHSLDIYLEAMKPLTLQDQAFYTTGDVAKLLHVDPETVRRYIRSKKLKAVKVGRDARIEKKDLDEFIKQRKR